MQDFQAKFPQCPTGMSASAYQHWVELGQCSRILSGECKVLCETVDEAGYYPVDFDHIVPASKDGSDTDFNLEPKCASWNRWGKSGNYDPDYLGECFFDQEVQPENLRINQNQHGYSLVTGAYRDIFKNPSNQILQTFCLLAWCVGTGKTVGMLSILMAINKVINAEGVGRKRIKKVLWMVHQKDLTKSISDECYQDPVKYGVIESAPRVAVVNDSADWSTVNNVDIVFACPQALWESKARKLTDQERVVILSRFDAIVIDECQFAVERYAEIFRQAPHALKFVMSATPMDGTTGKFLSEVKNGLYAPFFRLFSVFGYTQARQLDMLKKLPAWDDGYGINYRPVKATNGVTVERGSLVGNDDAAATNLNNCRDNAIIHQAVRIAESIDDYPAHVMVRVESIKQCKFLIKSIEGDPWRYFPRNRGWGVNAIYTGARPRISDPNHPWMVVKRDGSIQPFSGKSNPGTQRLLLAVDMGQFGLNNPYCSIVAWTSPNKSINELVQRIGRAIRIIPGLDPSSQSAFLLWPDDPDAEMAIKGAVRYLHDMEDLVASAFPGLLDTTEEVTQLAVDRAIPLSGDQKFIVEEQHGLALPEGLTPEDAHQLAYELANDPEQIEEIQQGIEKYVERLNSAEFRNSIFGLPQCAKFNCLSFVYSEASKDEFSNDELIEFVRSHPHYSALATSLIRDIREGREDTIQGLRKKIKQETDLHHQHSGKFIPVVELLGILTAHRGGDLPEDHTYFRKLKSWFAAPLGLMSASDRKVFSGKLVEALYTACSHCFGLPHFHKKAKDGIPGYAEFEPQLASALCSRQASRLILGNAKLRGLSMLAHEFPGHYALFADQIEQMESMEDEHEED